MLKLSFVSLVPFLLISFMVLSYENRNVVSCRVLACGLRYLLVHCSPDGNSACVSTLCKTNPVSVRHRNHILFAIVMKG